MQRFVIFSIWKRQKPITAREESNMKSLRKLTQVVAITTSMTTGGQTFGDVWAERPSQVSFQRCSSSGVDVQLMSELNPETVLVGLFFHLPVDFPVSTKFLHFESVGDGFVAEASESFGGQDATVELTPTGKGYRLRIKICQDQQTEREVLEDVLECRRGPF